MSRQSKDRLKKTRHEISSYIYTDTDTDNDISFDITTSSFGYSIFNGVPVGKTEATSFKDVERIPAPCGATSENWKICVSGRYFFLKRPKPQYMNDAKYLMCFEREFTIGFNLNSRYIIKYLAQGRDEESEYILMDYIKGETLANFIASRGRIPARERTKIIHQIAEALIYLHEHQIIHGDLKPDNIMITSTGHNVKLIDLGFAYSPYYKAISCGSKKFSAPEQFSEPEAVDIRSDIYAFGATIRYIESGAIADSNETYRGRFKHIIRKATEEYKNKRYSSVEEMYDSIKYRKSRVICIIAVSSAIAASALFFILNICCR